MDFSVLSSGSGGNCAYVEAEGRAVLIDCGLSLKELDRRLGQIGRDASRIEAVLLTHDHGDHVGSSAALARRRGVQVVATGGTHSVIRKLPPGSRRVLTGGEVLSVGPFLVRAISTPHDGIECVAFRLDHLEDGRSLGYATDLGYVDRLLTGALQGATSVVVEANHDAAMLSEGPYPRQLKKRISGPVGHLSNAQGAQLVRDLQHPGLRHVVLAHLSEQNNTPDAARRTFERHNRDLPSSVRLTVAQQLEPTDLLAA